MTEMKLLITAITALAGVIAYLFKLYVGQSKDSRAAEVSMTKEREGWVTERTKLVADHRLELEKRAADYDLQDLQTRGDYERKFIELRADADKRFREMLERYDGIARRDSESNRAHEDQVRKEFAEVMEKVAIEGGKSSAALVAMLQKLSDRFLGPRGY